MRFEPFHAGADASALPVAPAANEFASTGWPA
ncbi:hypothetical protein AvCA_28800 [Azotobacter vinelandii CA]|uniref:Uncharacterized protein n=2 Tax=Azotobacter vinelandii TaxID=354 RepID=C1DLW4_AZOVD|nr:hypothetical protein Avin_28800 [Azotobacter vinelandii DJ]AGK16525.1 hypothetical protein AvCA_28800 [Azotobacter vinelandii CA]AGK20926.1 hypothetical protein AvCA6_28800 [Azotobacter vinelandii CA6]